GTGTFTDTTGHVFEGDIARLAAADITRGCNPPANDRFCPDDPVTRGQMAAFLKRALSGTTEPPPTTPPTTPPTPTPSTSTTHPPHHPPPLPRRHLLPLRSPNPSISPSPPTPCPWRPPVRLTRRAWKRRAA